MILMESYIETYKLMGADDVCEFCDFSKPHLNRLLKDKKIPAKKVSYTWIFDSRDIEAFQAKRLERSKKDGRIMRDK